MTRNEVIGYARGTRGRHGGSLRVVAAGLVFVLLVLCGRGYARERDMYEAWEETLLFGIDSEVGSVLDQIAQSGETGLDDLIVERFLTSRSERLRVSIVEHFHVRESTRLHEAVHALLLDDEAVLGDELTRVSTTYLSQVVEDHSPQLLARYEQIAERGSLLASTIAIDAIGRNGSEAAVGLLLDLFTRLRGTDQRAAVLRALGRTGSDDALPLLSLIAADEFEESALRHYAAESLGRIGSPESVTLLTSLLGSSDSLLRAYATLALGFYDENETGALLEQALRDSFWRVRVAALQALGEQQRGAAVRAIEYVARRDPERTVRQAAIRSLGSIGNADSTTRLGDLARNERTGEAERILAVEQLARSGVFESREVLEELMAAEWDREGSRLLDAIGRFLSDHPDARLDDLYGRLMVHPNYIIRIYGMRAVGSAGLESRTDQLKEIARESPAGIVRRTALASLSAMGVDYDPEIETEDERVDDAGEASGGRGGE